MLGVVGRTCRVDGRPGLHPVPPSPLPLVISCFVFRPPVSAPLEAQRIEGADVCPCGMVWRPNSMAAHRDVTKALWSPGMTTAVNQKQTMDGTSRSSARTRRASCKAKEPSPPARWGQGGSVRRAGEHFGSSNPPHALEPIETAPLAPNQSWWRQTGAALAPARRSV